MDSSSIRLLAVNIGNTRVAAAVFEGASPGPISYAPASDPRAGADMIVELAHSLDDAPAAAVVMASVNPRAAQELSSALSGRLRAVVYHVGDDMPLPQLHSLGEPNTIGQDRLLNALAAYDTVKQACVVIDAGTAITIDFVDGEGVFQGGAIAPGARMQLRALHEQTAALPTVDLAWPDAFESFPKSTAQAMLTGVCYGIRGAVRGLVERFAEEYGGYPQVVVTGGDAQLLFGADEFIDNIVPHLTLRGIAIAARHALSPAEFTD